jgi:acetyltransferase
MSKISLETLLTPKSIAVVGASPKAGTVGNEVILNLQKGGYKGDLFFL